MPETAPILAKSSSHNVPAIIKVAQTLLTDLPTLYLATEVAGPSRASLDAKRRDLQRFHAFYQHLYDHDRPKGVHYAHEVSGHQSDRYIWRYVKPDRQTMAEAIDELE